MEIIRVYGYKIMDELELEKTHRKYKAYNVRDYKANPMLNKIQSEKSC